MTFSLLDADQASVWEGLDLDDEATLRRQARAVLDAGKLPRVRPVHTWGGSASGAQCVICGRAIEDELEFELEFPTVNGGGRKSHHLHARCFAAWEFERRAGSMPPIRQNDPAPLSNGQQDPTIGGHEPQTPDRQGRE